MKTNLLSAVHSSRLPLRAVLTLVFIHICYFLLSGQNSDLSSLLTQLGEVSAKSPKKEIHLINEDGKLETFYLINRGCLNLTDGTKIFMSYGQAILDDKRKIHLISTAKKLRSTISEDDHNYEINVIDNSYTWVSSDQHLRHAKCISRDKRMAKSDLMKRLSSDDLLVYELAITATPAYSAAHGNTTEDVLMSILGYINQVNTIYERELGIRIELIPESEKLIFLDGQPNPFPSQINAAVEKNIEILEDSIGIDNYDIGHLFRFGGGGLANSQVACTNNKAVGVSGFDEAGSFYKLIAHEIGHQLGASHTWNSCTNTLNQIQRSASSAMEPGSGITLMSYGGLCGANNISSQRDPYFHAISIEQITEYSRSGLGNTCAQTIIKPNSPPTITLATSSEKAIPIGTPFFLIADAIDADGDILTYAWDNVDQDEPADLGAQTLFNPIYRAQIPTSSNRRFIPKLSTLASGVNDLAEPLPAFERSIEFRLIVRDNHPGNGKVATSDFNVTVDGNAGPFEIVEEGLTNWKANGVHPVKWNVANTTNNKVDCQIVDILIDYDGLLEFKDTLATAVPNDGLHYISLPDTVTTTARIMVSAADNIFFDISDEAFAINRSDNPDFQIYSDATSETICALSDVSFPITSLSLNSFINSIRLTPIDLPEGITATLSQNDIVPGASSMLNLSFDPSISRGSKEVKINGFAANGTSQDLIFTLDIQDDSPTPVNLVDPLDSEQFSNSELQLSWNEISQIESYVIEISHSPTFDTSSIIQRTSSSFASIITNLPSSVVYFWRVKSFNGCSDPSTSAFRAFGIKSMYCTSLDSEQGALPLNQSLDSISSIITIADDFDISDVSISNIKGLHSYVGDLTFLLIAPNGSRYVLLDQECSESKNFDFGISSSGNRLRCGLDDNETYAPIESFEDLIGTSSAGAWELRIIDNIPGDAGQLDRWTLNICGLDNPGIPQMVNIDSLKLKPANSATLSSANISFTDSDNSTNQLTYIVSMETTKGYLIRGSDTLRLGDRFTQAEIDSGQLSYHHSNSVEETDSFSFYLTDGEGSISENHIVTIWINTSVAIEDLESVFGITISPNPTSDFIELQIDEVQSTELSIALIDINGQIAMQSSFKPFQNRTSFDVSHLPRGTWILRISDQEKIASSKVIIIR